MLLAMMPAAAHGCRTTTGIAWSGGLEAGTQLACVEVAMRDAYGSAAVRSETSDPREVFSFAAGCHEHPAQTVLSVDVRGYTVGYSESREPDGSPGFVVVSSRDGRPGDEREASERQRAVAQVYRAIVASCSGIAPESATDKRSW